MKDLNAAVMDLHFMFQIDMHDPLRKPARSAVQNMRRNIYRELRLNDKEKLRNDGYRGRHHAPCQSAKIQHP